MTKTVSAVALRAFSHAGDSFAKDQVIQIDPGHLADWSAEGVDLVRGATDDEVTAAKGDEAAAPEKPATRKTTTRKAKTVEEPTPPAESAATDPEADA